LAAAASCCSSRSFTAGSGDPAVTVFSMIRRQTCWFGVNENGVRRARRHSHRS
jgi:hypothetical protein